MAVRDTENTPKLERRKLCQVAESWGVDTEDVVLHNAGKDTFLTAAVVRRWLCECSNKGGPGNRVGLQHVPRPSRYQCTVPTYILAEMYYQWAAKLGKMAIQLLHQHKDIYIVESIHIT